eukprot:10324562-Prorocentrum_lima.AAC.1
MYAVVEDGKRRQLTPEELKVGHTQIYDLVEKGKYVDAGGEMKAINGDYTKIKFAEGLTKAA